MGELKIYNIPQDYRAALAQYDLIGVDTESGEVRESLTPEEQTLKHHLEITLREMAGDFREKFDYFARHYKELTAEAEAREKAYKEIKARALSIKAQAERLKAFMFELMKGMEVESVKGLMTSFISSRPSVKIHDENAVPQKFVKATIIEWDKTAIKAAIQAGESVPGASIERNTFLTIKG